MTFLLLAGKQCGAYRNEEKQWVKKKKLSFIYDVHI